MAASLGVVLTQMGGPADLDQVEPFIRSVFNDPAVVPLPGGPRVRRLVSSLVAKVRGRRVRERYREIGGGSPIGRITAEQAVLVRDELLSRGYAAEVVVALRYAQPDTAAALSALSTAGVERIVLLPLYPQYSFATTGSSEAEVMRLTAGTGGPPVTAIRSWCEQPRYLDALAGLVSEELEKLPRSRADRVALVFSAHGLPERLVRRGDPYPEEVQATVAGVLDRLAFAGEVRLGYQSRTGPVAWTGPGTDEVVEELGAAGVGAVVVIPVSFVSDHIETLHELDIELRRAALEAGITHFARVPALNTRPEVGPLLAGVVEEAL
ncbi:MAG: ferrochelatase [Actinobacteria bacterium]|nr:MAG: ferrochelatase [Actinomycetota bacterium]RIK05792.1 MAG: ferrochelatase [Acidobacteriota bacterium]